MPGSCDISVLRHISEYAPAIGVTKIVNVVFDVDCRSKVPLQLGGGVNMDQEGWLEVRG